MFYQVKEGVYVLQVGPLHKRPLAGGVSSLQHLFHSEQKTIKSSQAGLEVRPAFWSVSTIINLGKNRDDPYRNFL
jgi:hypothetical protein